MGAGKDGLREEGREGVNWQVSINIQSTTPIRAVVHPVQGLTNDGCMQAYFALSSPSPSAI